MWALRQEIEQQSRVVKSPRDKIAAAAAYYKQELSRNSKTLVDYAFEIGSQQVLDCQLDARAIRRLLAIDDPGDLSDDQHKMINHALRDQRHEIRSFLSENGYDAEKIPTVQQEMARGFVQGVAAAWEKLRKQM